MELLTQHWAGRDITIVCDAGTNEVLGGISALSLPNGGRLSRRCRVGKLLCRRARSNKTPRTLMDVQWRITCCDQQGTDDDEDDDGEGYVALASSASLVIDELTADDEHKEMVVPTRQRLRLLGGGCKQSSQLKEPPLQKNPSSGNSSPNLPQGRSTGPQALAIPKRPARPTTVQQQLQQQQQAPQQPQPPVRNPYELSASDLDDDDGIGDVRSFASDRLSEVDVLSAASGRSGRSVASSSFRSVNSSKSGGGGVRRRGSSALSVGSRVSRASHASKSSRGAASDTRSEVLSAASGGHSEKTLQRLVVDRNKELGRGGYGTVYRATDQRTRRQYAVKEVLFDERNVAMVETLRAEFIVLGKIRHPHIIRVYNFIVEEHGVARIVMELAPNGSVRSVARQMGGRLSERGAKRVIYQSLLGLHYLHTHGILHRDVKPDNMLMDKDGVVKLSDFGTCRLTMHVATGTATKVVGTVSYMSPESITGTFSMGSDLWGLAATFVELVSGKPPWHETGITQHVQLLFHIGSAKPPNHHPQFPANLSAEAVEFLTACFQLDVRQRPSAAQLLLLPFFLSAAADLAEVGSRPTTSTSPAEQPASAPPPMMRLHQHGTPSKAATGPTGGSVFEVPNNNQLTMTTASTTGGSGTRRQTQQQTTASTATGSSSLHTPRANPLRSFPEGLVSDLGSKQQQQLASSTPLSPSAFTSGGQGVVGRSSLRLSSPPQQQVQQQPPSRASSSDSFASWHSVESIQPPPAPPPVLIVTKPQQQQQQQLLLPSSRPSSRRSPHSATNSRSEPQQSFRLSK